MCKGSGEDILLLFFIIYTVLIERAIHNSMCSKALIHSYKTIHVYNNKNYLILCAIKSS